MRLDVIELEGFRNFDKVRVEASPSVNIIYGENAQGKTNFMEAISYLSLAKGFRARREDELIGFDRDAAFLTASGYGYDREFKLEARIFRGRARRQLLKNGVKLKNASELSGIFKSVLFRPEDIYIVQDGSAVRRKLLDDAISQLRPRYLKALSEYRRLYEHKSRILKDFHEKASLLDALPEFNLRMAQCGAIIVHYRAHFIKKLAEEASRVQYNFSGGKEELKVEYKTVSSISEPFAPVRELFERIMEHQEEHYRAETESGSCLTGPHKDDFVCFINGREAKSFASQGQMRTLSISLKLAEREICREDSGEYPVLLLDDVLSELDEKRQEFVMNCIAQGQVFISCCDDIRLSSLNSGRIFTVKNGIIYGKP